MASYVLIPIYYLNSASLLVSLLIYSFGVIKLDDIISESEF